MQEVTAKKDWGLTPAAFRLLLGWFDENADSAGQTYLEMRRRLVAYFDRKNCLAPDELADEALNRVARRLEEEGSIETETPAKYCYIVARFVFLEYLRTGRESRRYTARSGEHQTMDRQINPIENRKSECSTVSIAAPASWIRRTVT